MTDVNQTLAERGNRYGDFTGHGIVTQRLKDVMQQYCPGGATMDRAWDRLSPCQKEALDMIAHKIGRILNGDPN